VQEKKAGPIEGLEAVPIYADHPERVVRIGTTLHPKIQEELINFLRHNNNVFAWSHLHLCGISSNVISHALNVDPKHLPVKQKRRPLDSERYAALKAEVQRILDNDFIREAHYPMWISNLVLVKKAGGKS